MPEHTAVLLGILVTAAATYTTRLTGYMLGSRIPADSLASRVLDALPGAALAAVLAVSLTRFEVVDMLAVVVSAGLYLWTERTLLSLCAGLAVAVASAHLLH